MRRVDTLRKLARMDAERRAEIKAKACAECAERDICHAEMINCPTERLDELVEEAEGR